MAMMIGEPRAGSSLMRRHSLCPSMPGRLMSSRITPGFELRDQLARLEPVECLHDGVGQEAAGSGTASAAC